MFALAKSVRYSPLVTRTDQPSAEQASATPVRPPSRRELRKQWLAESGESAKPTSVFDLPFVPRRRFLSSEDLPVHVVEPVSAPEPESVDSGDLEGEVEQSAEELPQPVSAKQASRVAKTGTLPVLLPSPSLEPPVTPTPQADAVNEPVTVRDIELTVETVEPVTHEPVVAPTLSVESAVSVKPSAQPLGSTLLFDRIPDPEPEPDSVMGSTGPIVLPSSDDESELDAAEEPQRRRRLIPTILGAVAAFGLMVTMALPALGPRSGDAAAAEGGQGQILAAPGSDLPLIDIESFESLDELEAAAEEATIETGSFVNNPDAPVQYPFSKGVPLTDGFGPRSFPVAGFHDAQDFAANYGAAVRAIASGRVIESGPTSDGCGYGLKIEHRIDGQAVNSRYCHLATAPVVGVGQNVSVGQFVALVGNTGLSYGPHLHLVIEVEGQAVDPMPFLAKYNKPRNQW